MPVIGMAGMTHLGLVTGSAIASKGFTAICYDGDGSRIAALAREELPMSEPGLGALIAGNGGRQSFTADLAALASCDIVYIARDVPTAATGESDLASISQLIAEVSGVLNPQALLVILSQVPPGYTRSLIEFPQARLYYQVETLIFGRAVAQATKPERFIVGCAEPGRPLDARLTTLYQAFGCPVIQMGLESAELAKIAINMFLVSSVSLSNLMAELCERIGADWGEIVPALKLDRRIGPYAYLAPGLGIAGGNLERDLASLERIAAAKGVDTGLVASWRAISTRRRDWAAQTIRTLLLDARPDATLAIWGLAYKENTDSVRNSAALATIAQLGTAHLCLHDPAVPASAAGNPRAESATDPLHAARGADALLILTPWPQYRAIAAADIAKALAGRILVDPYGVVDAAAARRAGLSYHRLGRPPEFPDDPASQR